MSSFNYDKFREACKKKSTKRLQNLKKKYSVQNMEWFKTYQYLIQNQFCKDMNDLPRGMVSFCGRQGSKWSIVNRILKDREQNS